MGRDPIIQFHDYFTLGDGSLTQARSDTVTDLILLARPLFVYAAMGYCSGQFHYSNLPLFVEFGLLEILQTFADTFS